MVRWNCKFFLCCRGKRKMGVSRADWISQAIHVMLSGKRRLFNFKRPNNILWPFYFFQKKKTIFCDFFVFGHFYRRRVGGVLKMLGAYYLLDHGALRQFLLSCQSPVLIISFIFFVRLQDLLTRLKLMGKYCLNRVVWCHYSSCFTFPQIAFCCS